MTIFQKSKNTRFYNLHILFTSNNTVVTLLDFNGKIKFTTSSGQLDYKNSQKRSQSTTQHLAFFVAREILKYGITSINLRIKGLGKGRNFIVKNLVKAGLSIKNLYDLTPLTFNGCRSVKSRS